MTLYSQKDKNIKKTWLLFTLFLVIIIAVGWIFSRVYDSPWILYFAAIFSLLMNITAYWYSDKIVLRMYQAVPVEYQAMPELYRIVENLCLTAGLPMPKIYLIKEKQPNAFATGRNPQKAVIAVTEGLLEKLDRSELEGVIAHELAHIGNRDILLGTVVVVLVGFISILSDLFLRFSLAGGSNRRRQWESGGQIRGILIMIGILLAILAPMAAMLIQLAISRKREFLADASGALITRYPEGLARALEKISNDSNPMQRVNNTTAHLWIDDPFKNKDKISWLHRLFMTHPPVEERIKALRGLIL